MYNCDPAVVTFFAVCAVGTFLVFLVFREVTCWYFKINERLDVLAEIGNVLDEISKTLITANKAPDNLKQEIESIIDNN